jgi:cell shape-determining protein MreC
MISQIVYVTKVYLITVSIGLNMSQPKTLASTTLGFWDNVQTSIARRWQSLLMQIECLIS